MLPEQEPKAEKDRARHESARNHLAGGERAFLANVKEWRRADWVPEDDEGEVCMFPFDEDEDTTPMRPKEKVSKETMKRRKRLDQKLKAVSKKWADIRSLLKYRWGELVFEARQRCGKK
jgi:hypothetical protein